MNSAFISNEIIELSIDSYGSEGQGVGRYGGLAVFVQGALIGERVRAEITRKAPKYAEARLIEVLKKSPNRAEPPCPNFARCGGCDLMHMDYAHQLEFKRMKVENAFRRIGGFDGIKVRPCVPSPQTEHYRNKAVFSFMQSGDTVVSGTLAEASRRVVETSECLIQSEAAARALAAVTEWANRFHVPAYDEETGKGLLRHLMIRTSSLGETMVVLVSTRGISHEKELISALKCAVPRIKSVILNLNSERNGAILGKKYATLFGAQSIRERILDLDFTVSAQSFLQVNHAQTEKLYSQAAALLELNENDDAADLYCGIGTISILLAKQAKSVVGIECVSRAIDDARKNAEANSASNAEFLCGAAEKILPQLAESGRRISKLLLDPPRAGAEKNALNAVTKCAPERIVYVSCDPATLARDCKLLCNTGGFMIEYVQPFDMFPQTEHVETVTLITRAE